MTTALSVPTAPLVSMLRVESSLSLDASLVKQGGRTWIEDQPQSVLDAWLALTQSQATQVLALHVRRDGSVPQTVARAIWCARCVRPGSTLSRHPVRVSSARQVGLTRTRMHRLHAPSVLRARMQDALRHRATSAQLVRSTAMRTQRRRAQSVQLVSIGRSAQH